MTLIRYTSTLTLGASMPSTVNTFLESVRFCLLLSHQSNRSSQHQWRANPDNAAYSQQARDRGKLFHAVVEHHFQSKNIRLDSQDADEIALAQMAYVQPFWQSVENVLLRITSPLLIESAVWHDVGCYAGTVDMVCHFDGQLVILD